jgi:hypothetical protein
MEQQWKRTLRKEKLGQNVKMSKCHLMFVCTVVNYRWQPSKQTPGLRQQSVGIGKRQDNTVNNKE